MCTELPDVLRAWGTMHTGHGACTLDGPRGGHFPSETPIPVSSPATPTAWTHRRGHEVRIPSTTRPRTSTDRKLSKHSTAVARNRESERVFVKAAMKSLL